MELTRILIDNKEKLTNFLELIEFKTHIAFDTENGGEHALNPKFAIAAGFSVSVDGKLGFYIPINHTDLKLKDVFDGTLSELMSKVFSNKKLIIMHNAVYDAGILLSQYNYNITKYFWFDTMIGQHLLDEVNAKGLKKITLRYFDVKQDEYNFGDACKVKATDIYKYACDDAIYTYLHYEREKEQLKVEQLVNLMMKIEMPFQKTLLQIKQNGIYFDIEKAKEAEQMLLKDKENLLLEMIEVTPELSTITNLFGVKELVINIDSSKDLISLLYDKLNIPVKKTTEKGIPSVTAEALKEMKNGDIYYHPIIPLLIKYKKVQKYLSTYTKSLYEKVMPDGRIYCDLNDIGTVTGRLSSNTPNFQNIPKKDTYKIRSFFCATKGYIMFVPDFSQEELKVCGVITNSPSFKQVYRENQDLHLKVANEVWKLGIPEKEIISTHKNYEKHCETYNKVRFNAKSINFGLMYGMTAHKLQTRIGGTIEECQAIIDDYFKTFPEIKQAIENTHKQVKVQGFVRNVYGRKRRFKKEENKYGGMSYPNSALREAFNFKIQGYCSDILRVVMNALYKYINSQKLNQIRMLSTVHDEIMFEIKDDDMFEVHKQKIVDIMENTVKLSIPLTVDGHTGQNYSECK